MLAVERPSVLYCFAINRGCWFFEKNDPKDCEPGIDFLATFDLVEIVVLLISDLGVLSRVELGCFGLVEWFLVTFGVVVYCRLVFIASWSESRIPEEIEFLCQEFFLIFFLSDSDISDYPMCFVVEFRIFYGVLLFSLLFFLTESFFYENVCIEGAFSF